MRLVQWGHWNSNNVLTETTLLVNFDTHANNLKSFFLEQHVSVANFEKLFKSVFHLPNLSSLWSFYFSTRLWNFVWITKILDVSLASCHDFHTKYWCISLLILEIKLMHFSQNQRLKITATNWETFVLTESTE